VKLSSRELGSILFGAAIVGTIAYVFLGIAWAVAIGLLVGAAWSAALLRGFSSRELIVILGGAVFAFAVAACDLQIPWALSIGLLTAAAMAAVRWIAGPDFFEKIVLSGLLASIMAYSIATKIQFGGKAVAGSALVEDFAVNFKFGGKASLVYEVDGEPVRATIQTNFHFPAQGSELPILYLPEDPNRVEMASLWERYLLTGLVLLVSGGAALWEILKFLITGGFSHRVRAEDPLRVESDVYAGQGQPS
jgi:hypothetical protein